MRIFRRLREHERLDEERIPEVIRDKRLRAELMARLRAIDQSLPARHRILTDIETATRREEKRS